MTKISIGGGKTVTVYHGTSETSLDRILRQGLKPTKRKNHPQSDDFVYLEKSAKAARSWGRQANAQRVAVLEIEIPEEILKRDGKTLSGSSFKTGSIPSAWIKGWDIYHLNARTGELEFVRSENNPGFSPASPDDPRFGAEANDSGPGPGG